jgi:hypothetical protein
LDIGYYAKPGALRLFAWHDIDNFGDRLGPALFHLVTGRPVCIEARGLTTIFDQGPPREIQCFLGTLAQFLEGPHRFVAWGLGTAPPDGPSHHGCQPMTRDLDIEFRALRGPLTRRVLEDAGYKLPEVLPYGDPGLLVPYFYNPSRLRVDDFCIVPHHTQYERVRQMMPDKNVIDIRVASYEGLQALIAEVTKYRAVFSSSLHVSIMAEAFGVPVRPIAPTLPFKFDDFYAACGKQVEYLPEIRPDLDWYGLYEELLRTWKPLDWDPVPWMQAAPVPVDPGIAVSLKTHYDKLRRQKAKRSSLKRDVRERYALAQSTGTSTTQARLAAEAAPSDEVSGVLFEDTFRSGLDDWQLSPDGGLAQETFRATESGCLIRREPNAHYIASPRLSVGDMADVTFTYELAEAEGLMQVILQDEAYETWDKRLVTSETGPGAHSVSFVPTRPDMSLRLVFLPLDGHFLVSRVTATARCPVGLSHPLPDKGESEIPDESDASADVVAAVQAQGSE